MPSNILTKIPKREIFTLVFWIFLLGLAFSISGIVGVLLTLFSFFIYAFFGYAITIVWRLVWKKPFLLPHQFLLYFAHRIAVLFTAVTIVLGSFCYYQNEINPAYLPRYTITNGKKTVVFQTMAHIATDRFYTQVQSNIKAAKKSGYVLFFE